jgi:hypothetical protein
MTNSVKRCAECTILSFLLGEGKAGRRDEDQCYLMIMLHKQEKPAYLDFVSCPSFCNMKTVMFQKWG